MSAELAAGLDRVAGGSGPVPDVADLWHRGRSRRRRRRVASGAAALLVVAALAGVAVAVVDGSDAPEGVVAGPGAAPPPPEPGGPVRMVVGGGPALGGLPTVLPGDGLSVLYVGNEDVSRGMGFDWEQWDGAAWRHTHVVVEGEAWSPDEDDRFVPAVGVLGPGPVSVGAPDDVGPGWHRLCQEVVAGTRPQRVCGQVRVVAEGGAPAPPAEAGSGPVALTGPDEVVLGRPFTVRATGARAGWGRVEPTRWQAWDGEEWATTHLLAGDRVVHRVGDADVGTGDAGLGEVDLRAPDPSQAAPGRYRICADVVRREGGEEAEACLQVDAVLADDVLPDLQPLPDDGDAATWELDPATTVDAESDRLSVLVTRVGCNDGVTGAVLQPGVQLGADTVTITYTVERAAGMADCPGNGPEPAEVVLGEPLGHRRLVDGTCATEAVAACEGGGLRYTPPG